MRVLPINSFNKSFVVKNNKKFDNSTVETVTKADSISFKSSYESVFREGLYRHIDRVYQFKELFEQLVKSVRTAPECLIAKSLKQYTPTGFEEAYGYYRKGIDGPLDERVLFKTRAGSPLMTACLDTIDFYAPGNNYTPNSLKAFHGDYIRFSKEEGDYCLSRPLHEVILWSSTGRIKEDIKYVDHDGRISSHKYYHEDGTRNGWKNFFFGT